jgi:dTDP-4-dehydrorhamnose reductase
MQKIFLTPHAARALPRKFRRMRVLVIGCGDVGLRLLRQINHPWPSIEPVPTQKHTLNITTRHTNLSRQHAIHCFATARRQEQAQEIRAYAACQTMLGDLNNTLFLKRIVSLTSRIIMLAPPSNSRDGDHISRYLSVLLRAKAQTQRAPHRTQNESITWRTRPYTHVSYVSTTGVYGDCQGQWVTETSPTHASSARALRRVIAEQHWRSATTTGALRVSILRAPGIYARERLPIERLQRGTPAIIPAEDSYSNHIHADDLARLAWLANLKGKGSRVFNAVDEHPMRMGDYFDQVADHFSMPRPVRLTRADVQSKVSPMMWSFMNESRRIKATRFKELRFRLKYPTVDALLKTL